VQQISSEETVLIPAFCPALEECLKFRLIPHQVVSACLSAEKGGKEGGRKERGEEGREGGREGEEKIKKSW